MEETETNSERADDGIDTKTTRSDSSFVDRTLLSAMEGLGELAGIRSHARALAAAFAATLMLIASPAAARAGRAASAVEAGLLVNVNYTIMQTEFCESTVAEIILWLQSWGLLAGFAVAFLMGLVAVFLFVTGYKKAAGASILTGIAVGVILLFALDGFLSGVAAITGVDRCETAIAS